MDISDITATDLQDDIIGPIIIEEYREQVTKRMKDEQYMRILSIYIDCAFQDFQSFLRTEIDLVEDDIKLVLNDYISCFITYKLTPGIYTFKDISEALLKIFQPEYESYHNAIDIEYDNITMRTKLVVRPGIISIRFDEQSFFSTILGFTSGWDYEQYNEYISQKILNLSSTKKLHLNRIVSMDLLSTVFNKHFYIVLFQVNYQVIKYFPNQKQYIIKKINKPVLNSITFYLEDVNIKEIFFNGETLIFTIQLIKI